MSSKSVIDRLEIKTSERRPVICMPVSYDRTRPERFDMHYALELGLVLSGRMRRYCHGWRNDLKPGQVWLCGVWEPHGVAITRVPCSVLVFAIHPPMLSAARFDESPDLNMMSPFLAAPADRPRITAANAGRMLEMGRRISRMLADQPARSEVWLRLMLMEILLMLMERWTPPAELSKEMSRFSRRIGPALEMVFSGSRRVSLDRAAESCGLSRGSFTRLFRRAVGMSFARFSMRHRLSMAASELMRSDRPIKAVASHLGFVDDSHLNHSFRRHYGCSLIEFRARRLLDLPDGGT